MIYKPPMDLYISTTCQLTSTSSHPYHTPTLSLARFKCWPAGLIASDLASALGSRSSVGSALAFRKPRQHKGQLTLSHSYRCMLRPHTIVIQRGNDVFPLGNRNNAGRLLHFLLDRVKQNLYARFHIGQ